MTRYLDTLIAQARGAESQVKPRLRSRFEPDLSYAPELMSEDVLVTERIEPAGPALSTRSPDAPFTEVEARTPTAKERPAPEPGRDTVHHIHEHTERIERIDHYTTERGVPAVAPKHEPERIIIEQIVERNAPVEDRRLVPSHEKTEPSPPSNDRAVGVHVPTRFEDLDPPRRTTERDQVPSRRSQPLTVLAEVASNRIEPAREPEIAAAPEITISIGVLDIRITQESQNEWRPAPRREERRDNTLPLADYLAKRSGSAS